MSKYYNGGSVTGDSGAFRLRVLASYSSGKGITCVCKAQITNAFKSEHKFTLTYYNYNATEKTKSKTVKNKTKLRKAGTYNIATFTIPYEAVTQPIKLKISGVGTSKITKNTIQYTELVPKVLNTITVDDSDPTNWNVYVTGEGTTNQPVSKVYLEYTNVVDASDSDYIQCKSEEIVATNTAYEVAFEDIAINDGYYYRFRARGSSTISGTEYYAPWIYSDGYYAAPSETSDVSIDSSTNTITWTATLSDISNGIVKGWYVERRDSNSSVFNILATINAVSGQIYYSYTDTTGSTGKTYYYKVVAFNDYREAWDTEQTEVTLEGIPSTPTSNDFTYYYNADGSVTFKFTSEFEDAYIEESSSELESWTQIAHLEYPTITYTDSSATTDSYYRVRFSNSTGYSDYSEVVHPITPTEPAAPTITWPYNNTYADASGSQYISWTYNTTDNSPQYSYTYQTSTDGGTTWSTAVTITSENTYLYLSGASFGETDVYFRIKTTSTNNLTSSYCTAKCIKFYTTPDIIINSPTGEVTSLPLELSFTYTGASGLSSLNVKVINYEGESIFNENYSYDGSSTSLTDTISLMGILFEEGLDYTIKITATSARRGVATYQTHINVEYDDSEIPDGALMPLVKYDEDTGFAYISVVRNNWDEDEQEEYEDLEISEAYLYRKAGGETELLGEVKEDDEITDIYAPLNVTYQYALLQIFDDGTACNVVVDTSIDSHDSYILWGSNHKNVIKARWNPVISNAINKPERQIVRYSGREYPVVYDSKAKEEKSTFSADVTYEELSEIIRFIHSGQVGLWKSVQGRSYNAIFDINWSRVKGDYALDLYTVTLTITRTN